MRKGTKFFCKLHVSRSKSAIFYESLTIYELFLRLFVAELVDIDISACLFRGVVEEAELGTHEEAAPVEAEAVVFGTDLCPCSTVEAIGEVSAVCPAKTTHTRALSWTEVSIDAEENLRRGKRNLFDDLFFETCHFLITVGKLAGHLHHLEGELLALLLDDEGACVTVESGQTGTVAVLHLRTVDDNGARALRTLHALGEGIRSEVKSVDHAIGFQAEESRTLRETPRGINGIVVPLPVKTEFRL